MFVTQDDSLYERVLTLSNHGRIPTQSRQFWPEMIGFKYKMSNLQAAIGCAQLERIQELLAKRRRIFEYYQCELNELPIRMNPEPTGTLNGYWMPTVVVDTGLRFDRTELLQQFAQNNIDGRVFFWPLSMLSMFEQNVANDVSYSLYHRGVNLPSYHDISISDQDRVVAQIKRSICA
jgi:perosamine synthetase